MDMMLAGCDAILVSEYQKEEWNAGQTASVGTTALNDVFLPIAFVCI